MILDVNTVLSTNQALTVTADSTGIYDVAGYGYGVKLPTSVILGVQNTVFGEDIGIGDGASPPQIAAIVGTAFTAAGSATLQTALLASIDDGNGNASSWKTLIQTDTIGKALLTAGALAGKFAVPSRYLGQGFPRFYKLTYTIATGPMTAGTIAFAGIVTGIDQAPMYPSGF